MQHIGLMLAYKATSQEPPEQNCMCTPAYFLILNVVSLKKNQRIVFFFDTEQRLKSSL